MAVSEVEKDPYSQPSFSAGNRLARAAWGVVEALLFRTSPRPLHAWRAFLLTCFGAKLGPGCHIYPKAQIWAPWNLICEDVVAVADGAIVYNPSPVTLGSHATISQEAYLCGASHDYRKPDFPLISAPIHVGAYAWVCARATVQMGVHVGEGAILATGGVATKNIGPWTIAGGVPAKQIGTRPRTHSTGQEHDENHHKNGQGRVPSGR
jgi:putative colanic acid biosynthesis acetyltransferase WcaF